MNAKTITFEQKLAAAELMHQKDVLKVRDSFIRRRAKVRPETTFLMYNRFDRARELFRAKQEAQAAL